MNDSIRPTYRKAAWDGEAVTLRSGDVTMSVFRRRTGWGWAQVDDGAGGSVAVLDHLGELALRDAPVPMRLESPSVKLLEGPNGGRLVFEVSSVVTAAAIAGSSFETWVGAPHNGPILIGTVSIEATGEGGFDLSWRLESRFDVLARWLRGPWLRVGEASFGADRDEAILPGVDWTQGNEWTSGDDWFREPWSWRATPPVDSVAIPIMAVSRRGAVVSVSWEPDREATGWFSMAGERAQPVFAVPNFIERNDTSLLGLMLPESRPGADNGSTAPLELHRGQSIRLDAHLAVQSGTALDGVVAWVRAHGMPEPSTPRWSVEESLHRIARSYATGLWHEGVGFGTGQVAGDIRPLIPAFAGRYLERFGGSPDAELLRDRMTRLGDSAIESDRRSDSPGAAEELLEHQNDDGSFRFDPAGRHRSKDDFVVARDLVAPMGQQGDAALDFDAVPAITLLRAHEVTGDPRFLAAGLAALDHAARFTRPEGGDFWETPLHSPNLFAAGHGAIASALAWRIAGREEDRLAGARWLRSLLPFTHLWTPRGRPMLYNTKPCLCASDWYFANWVRDHVQWEVLETFALAADLNLDLAALDPELDWDTYHRGITWAAVRWLLDHRDGTWRPHNIPESLDRYDEGEFDMCLPDTHNSTTGRYGGMAIPASVVALNLLAIDANSQAKTE